MFLGFRAPKREMNAFILNTRQKENIERKKNRNAGPRELESPSSRDACRTIQYPEVFYFFLFNILIFIFRGDIL